MKRPELTRDPTLLIAAGPHNEGKPRINCPKNNGSARLSYLGRLQSLGVMFDTPDSGVDRPLAIFAYGDGGLR